MNNKSKTKNPALIAMFALALLVPGAALQSAHASGYTTVNVDSLVNEMTSIKNKISQLNTAPVNNATQIKELNDKFWAINDLINTVTDVDPQRDFLSEWETLETKQDSLESTLETMKSLGVSAGFDQVLNGQINRVDVEIEQYDKQVSNLWY